MRLEPGRKAKSPLYDTTVGNRRAIPLHTMPAWEKLGEPSEIKTPTNPVASVRSERGNLDTKYDHSPGQTLKSLRPQFGTNYDGKTRRNKYDAKKVGNSYYVGKAFGCSV